MHQEADHWIYSAKWAIRQVPNAYKIVFPQFNSVQLSAA